MSLAFWAICGVFSMMGQYTKVVGMSLVIWAICGVFSMMGQ